MYRRISCRVIMSTATSGSNISTPRNLKNYSRITTNSSSSSLSSVRVVTSDFWGKFRKKCQGIKRYKVHAPSCTCSKVQSLRKRVGESHNDRLFDDSLLVLPDVQKPSSCFVFGLDHITDKYDGETEDKRNFMLWHESYLKCTIYKEVELMNLNVNEAKQNYITKISCAQCLLNIEPNGFVCITSTAYESVAAIQDLAVEKRYKKMKLGITLHSDHAHYVCVVSRKVLFDILNARTESEVIHSENQIIAELEIDVLSERRPFKLGHHLKSVLNLTYKNSKYDDTFWFVKICNTSDRFTIDLPGGKRHLGEDAYECAVRETQEETSLLIEKSWLDSDLTKEINCEGSYNKFFMLRLPSSFDTSEELESNVVEKFVSLTISKNI